MVADSPSSLHAAGPAHRDGSPAVDGAAPGRAGGRLRRGRRGFLLVKVAGGYRYQSHPDLAPYVERFVLDGPDRPAVGRRARDAGDRGLQAADLAGPGGVHPRRERRRRHADPRSSGATSPRSAATRDRARRRCSARPPLFLERLGLDVARRPAAAGRVRSRAPTCVEPLEQRPAGRRRTSPDLPRSPTPDDADAAVDRRSPTTRRPDDDRSRRSTSTSPTTSTTSRVAPASTRASGCRRCWPGRARQPAGVRGPHRGGSGHGQRRGGRARAPGRRGPRPRRGRRCPDRRARPASSTTCSTSRPAWSPPRTIPQGRPTVIDLVPAEPRVFPVGRLDLDTEGLLLLTNDGELTHRLTHPSLRGREGVPGRGRGSSRPGAIRRLREGVELEDGMTAPAKVDAGRPGIVRIVDPRGPQPPGPAHVRGGRPSRASAWCGPASGRSATASSSRGVAGARPPTRCATLERAVVAGLDRPQRARARAGPIGGAGASTPTDETDALVSAAMSGPQSGRSAAPPPSTSTRPSRSADA